MYQEILQPLFDLPFCSCSTLLQKKHWRSSCIGGLYPQRPHHFSWQPSVRVSQNLWPSYLSHVTAAATWADEYWHLHHPDCRNTMKYIRAHDLAHSPDLWHRPRLLNNTCAWSRGLYGIAPVLQDLEISILCYSKRVEGAIQIYTTMSTLEFYLPPSLQSAARFRR